MTRGQHEGRAPWPDFVHDFTRRNAPWLAALGFVPAPNYPGRAVFHSPQNGALLVAEWDPWDVCMNLGLGPPLGRPGQEILAYPLHLYGEAVKEKDPRLTRHIREAARDGSFKDLRRLLQELMPRYNELLPEVIRLWQERTGEARPTAAPKPLPPDAPNHFFSTPKGRQAQPQALWSLGARAFGSRRRLAALFIVGYGLTYGSLSMSVLSSQWHESPRMRLLKSDGVSRMARVELHRFGPYHAGWAEAVVASPDGGIARRVQVYARHEAGSLVPVLCDRVGCVEAEKVDLHVRWWPFTPQAILSYLGLLVWLLGPFALLFWDRGGRPPRPRS